MRPVGRVTEFLKHQPRLWLYLEALALTLVIALVDFVTGYEVSIYPFTPLPSC